MREQVHFDAYVAPKVFQTNYYVSDKFFIFPGLIVAKKVNHNINKSLPRFNFIFIEFSNYAPLMSCQICSPRSNLEKPGTSKQTAPVLVHSFV